MHQRLSTESLETIIRPSAFRNSTLYFSPMNVSFFQKRSSAHPVRELFVSIVIYMYSVYMYSDLLVDSRILQDSQ